MMSMWIGTVKVSGHRKEVDVEFGRTKGHGLMEIGSHPVFKTPGTFVIKKDDAGVYKYELLMLGVQISDGYINLNSEYMNAEVELGVGPLFLASIPLIYYIPTLYVIKAIVALFLEIVSGRKDETINPHVLLVIVLHLLSAFFLMISDYANVRIPATGLMTSWCASQEPSYFIKFLFWLSIYFNYLTMIFPFLLAVLRMIPVFHPQGHSKMSNRVVRTVTPLVFLYPLAFTWFMVPARGVCKQFPAPYKFGAVYTYFIDSYHHLVNYPFLLLNSTVWLTMSVVAHAILYRKLRKIGSHGKSARFQKAEFSLTLTTVSLTLSYFANTIFLIIFGFFTDMSHYFVMIRSFGNDCDAVIVPWIFFLVHPAFRGKLKFLRKLIFGSHKIVSVRNVSTC